jgi:copper chaperone
VTETVQRIDAGAQLQVDLPQHRVSIASQQPAERFVAALTEEGYPPA